MRADAGFVAAHLLLVLVGAALLHALRLVDPRPRSLLAALGPAYLAGIAAVVPVLILLLVIGIPFRTPVVVLVCLAEAAVLVVVGRRRPPAEPAQCPPRTRIERIILTLAATALGAWSLWVAWAFAHLPIQLDDARIWSLKSFALFYYDHLDMHVFDSAPYAPSHLDYPILQPTLLAAIYRLMGEATSGVRHIALWIIVVAFLWTAAWLLARRLAGVVWLVPLVALGVAPAIYTNVKLGYSDAFYACFLALGALLVGDWIEGRRPASLVLATLMLGAAANGKNEGTVGAFAILLCAGAVVAAGPGRRSALIAWAAAAAGVLAMVAPWQIWIAAHGIHNTDQPRFGDAISPSHLGDQIDRLGPAVTRVLEQALSAWPLFLVGLLGVAIVHLIARRRTQLAAYYLAATLLLGFTVVFAYWTGTLPLEFQLDTSVDRTVTGTLVVAALGLAHLLGAESDDTAAESGTLAAASASRPCAAIAGSFALRLKSDDDGVAQLA